jgi:copper oxidase (laccase) domain-containing protein
MTSLETVSATSADPRYATIEDFADWGFDAFVTTRAAGSFASVGDEPVGAVTARWDALRERLFGAVDAGRLATARQVHGAHVWEHHGGWDGWLRAPAGDGHLCAERGTACAVSVADCVPVFVGHPSGAMALLHSGWRGTEADILAVAVRRLAALGARATELRVVLGPAICGRCYEVSPEVYARLTGTSVARPTPVDLRAVIADRARARRRGRAFDAGVHAVRQRPLLLASRRRRGASAGGISGPALTSRWSGSLDLSLGPLYLNIVPRPEPRG